jgi:hypothetical protein
MGDDWLAGAEVTDWFWARRDGVGGQGRGGKSGETPKAMKKTLEGNLVRDTGAEGTNFFLDRTSSGF